MTTDCSFLRLDQPDLLQAIGALSDEELDQLDFGVIGIDGESVVRQYNKTESKFAGLSRDRSHSRTALYARNIGSPWKSRTRAAITRRCSRLA